MSETLESPALDAELPVEAQTEAPQTNAVVETGAEGGDQPEVRSEQPQQDKTPAWLQRKIDKMTFERREAERREQAKDEELAQMRRALAASRGEEQEREPLTEDQIRQEERQRYETQQAQQNDERAFIDRSNAIAKALAASHGDAAVAQATQFLSERAGLDFSNKSHRELISDISELPNSGDVYYALAHDPDAASAILDASPRRQYALLIQLATSVGKPTQAQTPAPPAISRAPAPVSAPSGAAATGKKSIYDPNVSPAEFDRLWKAGVRT